MTKDEMIEAIEKMTVLELSDLVKALEEKFGVKTAAAMAPVAAGAPAGGGAAAAAPEEEKYEFNVVLKEFGPKKIEVIKVVRELTARSSECGARAGRSSTFRATSIVIRRAAATSS